MLANPYAIIAIILVYAGSVGVVGFKSYQMGQDHLIAQQAKERSIEDRTREAAIAASAEAISKIEVRNVTIRQKAETITREVPVYGDCRHDPAGLQLVNDALRAPGQPVDPGKLPGAGPAH